MFDINPITSENIDQLEPLYAAFQQVAQADYGWPLSAIDFNGIRRIFKASLMHGYLIKDFHEDRMVGFLFYSLEGYGALEIKVIYLAEDVPVKSVMDTLFNRFMEDIRHIEGWEVLSYPILGPGQARYTHYITWFGFKPVGQAVVKFHMFDGITIEIFKKQTYQEVPEGYRFISWDPKYEAGVIDVLTEAFADSVDALWDPRFKNREGISEAVAFVKSGGYGLFWPECNTILLNPEDKPVGVCLLNIVSPEEANIPLVGLLKSERQHKLGRSLLAQTVDKCINEVLKGKLKITTVSATVATGNIPAIKMYRHTAFQEDHWYPHAYQERNSVLMRKPGQWC